MRKIPAGAGNKGFTLLEMAVVLAVLALVATAAIPYFIRHAELTAAQRTAKEVSSIQEAAKWYRIQTNSWPSSVVTLQSAGFLNPSWAPANPWGNAYSISSGGTSLTVTTHVPDSVGGILTRVLPGASSWVTGSWRGVNSTVPVPGQEASLTSVTNLASSALSMAQSSAVPPYGSLIWNSIWGSADSPATMCPPGYVMVGWNGYTGGGVQWGIWCQRVSR